MKVKNTTGEELFNVLINALDVFDMNMDCAGAKIW